MKCDQCGKVLEVGEWPFCGDGRNAHGKPTPSKGFLAYFDIGLGAHISTPGDRNKLLRPQWKDDYVEHIQPRDLPDSHYRETKQRLEARQRGEL